MIILTGGAGFIGSCFLWKLNQQGIDDVIVVDHLGKSEKWRNLCGKRFSDYIQKDKFLELIDQDKFTNLECVIHIGACSSTTFADADYFIENNYQYSKKIALWAFKHKARFLYASSAATYGSGEFGYNDNVENMYRLKPLNMYGYSKSLFDLWILNNGYIDQVTGFKFFNVFGPNEYHKAEMMSVICKKFAELKSGCIKLFKSYNPQYNHGEQKRDFVYIKDVVDIMDYFFQHQDKTGIFNLGTGRAHTWNELALAMFAAIGKTPQIEYIEMPDYLKSKYQYFTEAKIDKLRAVGCNIEFQPFEIAVKDYLHYLEKHEYL
ncbi:MAG: ADP-glyceromanno-heptose 6-epimerase [Candidatus Omnitrophota bacterium]|nr:MAG: ADP-glyceromanno-heptose 6-epimerase [Candidatus Omnitrophota bacterium]